MTLAIQILVDVFLLTSVWVLPSHRRSAMVLLMAGQGVLLGYLVSVGQLGFWPWNLGMIIVAARNWRRWSRESQPV